MKWLHGEMHLHIKAMLGDDFGISAQKIKLYYLNVLVRT